MEYKQSDNASLVLLGSVLALFVLFHAIFNILLEEWIKHQLASHFGYTVAEMIERFGAIALPAGAAGCVVWLLFQYLKRDFKRELQKLLAEHVEGAFPDEMATNALPDWPIRNLFFHINPNVLDVQPDDDAPWQTLRNRIRDALALGKFTIWGRIFNDVPLLGLHSVPEKIETVFWKDAEFTYTFFIEDNNGRPETHIWGPKKQELPTYTDLRVNQKQAEAWAKE
jgi:hypothetical protein